MKTSIKILATAFLLGGLAVTLAGCNKSSGSNKTATLANWNVSTSTKVEDNFADMWKTKKEVAKYSVEFVKSNNSSYSLVYDPAPDAGDISDKKVKSYMTSAEYTTEFYMKSFDWKKDTIEDFRLGENDKNAECNVYVFTTSLTISGKFVKGSNEHAFTDHVNTVCYYRMAGDNLKPVYSLQDIKSTSPNLLQANSLNGAYITTNARYETFYNYKRNRANLTTTLRDENDAVTDTVTKTYDVGTSYTLLDNCQSRAAIRAFSLSGSKTYKVFSPQNKCLQSCSVSFSSAKALESGDTHQKQILDAMDACKAESGYIFFNGNTTEKGELVTKPLRYTKATMSVGGSLKGYAPTYWYSTVENNDLNSTRAVLLYMSTPIAFSCGTLNYALKELHFVDINS